MISKVDLSESDFFSFFFIDTTSYFHLAKLPELARELCSPTAKHLYSHLIDKQHYNRYMAC